MRRQRPHHLPRADMVVRGAATTDELPAALELAGISYCQWKGHADTGRWQSAEGDIDLLVSRSDAGRCLSVLAAADFKEVIVPERSATPGVRSFYRFDEAIGRFVHVHVHYQLWLGDDAALSCHLPLETALLRSAGRGRFFRVPAPEFDAILFVIRMVLGQTILSTLFRQREVLSPRRAREWQYLSQRAPRERVHQALREHLPMLAPAFFDRCVETMSPACSIRTRYLVKRQLQSVLRVHLRRSPAVACLVRLKHRFADRLRKFRVAAGEHRPAAGGVVLAILGGDGAGKTTAVSELATWLSQLFAVERVHLGKPTKSLLTISEVVVRRTFAAARNAWCAVRSGQMPNPESQNLGMELLIALRTLCIARDRYRLYRRTRRLAAKGRVVICDRYPSRFIRCMDGPDIRMPAETRWASWMFAALRRAELRYYDRILPPDRLVLLRLHPDIAAARKTDEEPNYVRERSREVWQLDLRDAPVDVIDASRSQSEVLAQLRAITWKAL